MRLPWGTLTDIGSIFLRGTKFSILGCLSFEDRCRTVPKEMFTDNCNGIKLLEIRDPDNAFPDYTSEARLKIEENRQKLIQAGVCFESRQTDLLATEDELLDILQNYVLDGQCKTLIFDISSMPKRYFCFLVKRMLITSSIQNLMVTYTSAGLDGYTPEHLAEDPMSCDQLPGYYGPLPPRGDTLILSVGFESLNLRSLIEIYQYKRENTKMILSFPPDGRSFNRIWRTIMQLVSGNAQDIDRANVEIMAAWDAGLVYRTLERWEADSNGLTLAPFGPKPHSLGMALFAVKFDCGLFYTQPKSYNPEYCKGQGETWAYVLKWEGVPCFERPSQPP